MVATRGLTEYPTIPVGDATVSTLQKFNIVIFQVSEINILNNNSSEYLVYG